MPCGISPERWIALHRLLAEAVPVTLYYTLAGVRREFAVHSNCISHNAMCSVFARCPILAYAQRLKSHGPQAMGRQWSQRPRRECRACRASPLSTTTTPSYQAPQQPTLYQTASNRIYTNISCDILSDSVADTGCKTLCYPHE